MSASITVPPTHGINRAISKTLFYRTICYNTNKKTINTKIFLSNITTATYKKGMTDCTALSVQIDKINPYRFIKTNPLDQRKNGVLIINFNR